MIKIYACKLIIIKCKVKKPFATIRSNNTFKKQYILVILLSQILWKLPDISEISGTIIDHANKATFFSSWSCTHDESNLIRVFRILSKGEITDISKLIFWSGILSIVIIEVIVLSPINIFSILVKHESFTFSWVWSATCIIF